MLDFQYFHLSRLYAQVVLLSSIRFLDQSWHHNFCKLKGWQPQTCGEFYTEHWWSLIWKGLMIWKRTSSEWHFKTVEITGSQLFSQGLQFPLREGKRKDQSSINTHRSNSDRPRRKALLGSAQCTLTQRRPSCFKTLRLARSLRCPRFHCPRFLAKTLSLKFLKQKR